MLHTIISNGWHDQAYIDERCEGFDDLWETVKDYPAERAAEITGVPAETIVAGRRALRDARRAPASSTRWASPSTRPARPT